MRHVVASLTCRGFTDHLIKTLQVSWNEQLNSQPILLLNGSKTTPISLKPLIIK